MKFLLLLVIMLFPSMASAGEFRHFSQWTNEQKAEFFAYSAISYVDYKQTTWALRQRDYAGNRYFYEINPILGKYPSDRSVAILALVGVSYYYYLIGNDSRYPKFSLMGRTAMFSAKTVVILHNDSIGVSISKVW